MRRGLACWAAAALILADCEDRRAGTEVGNPELTMTVTARFAVFDNQQEVDVKAFDMNVLKMRYVTVREGAPIDSGICWKRPGGILVDLAAWESVPLQDTLVRFGLWTSSEIVLRTPDGPPVLPDTADFASWSDPRHARFNLVRNNDTLRALFEMPAGMEIHLLYSQDMIPYWLWGDTMSVPFYFDAGKWAGSLDLLAPWATRKDGRRRPYVLFSPSENAAAWTDLKKRFPGSFVADTIRVQ